MTISKEDYPFKLMAYFNTHSIPGLNMNFRTPHGVLHLYWYKMRWQYEWIEILDSPLED